MSEEFYENKNFIKEDVIDSENRPLDNEKEINDDVDFAEELEHYLPTKDNTDKVKKVHFSPLFLSILFSTLTCIIICTVYSMVVLPNITPKTVISYTGENSAVEAEAITNLSDVIEKATPCIVTVSSQSDFQSFFGFSTQQNSGTGIIISENGYILTGNSLIGSNGEATVTIGKESYPAKIVNQDASKDIAIIQIDKVGLTPITLADSNTVKVGDTAIVMGNLLGEELGISATKGIICGVNKNVSLSNGSTINLIQTDAVTSNTCTGGCILNSSGNLVAMITNSISSGNDNISLAIPSNDISAIFDSALPNNSLSGLTIGIQGSDTEHGVTVDEVVKASPADKADIKKGDLILKVDNSVVKSVSDINKIRDSHKKGDTITITIYRDGEIIDINVTL